MRWLGLWQKKEVWLSPELTSRLTRALSEMSEFSDKDQLRRLVTSTLPSTFQLEARYESVSASEIRLFECSERQRSVIDFGRPKGGLREPECPSDFS